MPNADTWTTITQTDYQQAFDRFGGSFAVHPRVVALVAKLAKRPARYVGLARNGTLIAAVPLWDDHILATGYCLECHDALELIDVGDSEVILPIDSNARITVPFIARSLSPVHATNIINLAQDPGPYAQAGTMGQFTFAKTGDADLSGKTRHARRRQIRRFAEMGGNFRPVKGIEPTRIAEIYVSLYGKRRYETTPQGAAHLATVLTELHDLLAGAILFLNDRPVAMELIFAHQTPSWLLVNGVQRVVDPEFLEHSVGTQLTFQNAETFRSEAMDLGKALRFCHGWDDAPYKSLWTTQSPGYRLIEVPGERRAGQLLQS